MWTNSTNHFQSVDLTFISCYARVISSLDRLPGKAWPPLLTHRSHQSHEPSSPVQRQTKQRFSLLRFHMSCETWSTCPETIPDLDKEGYGKRSQQWNEVHTRSGCTGRHRSLLISPYSSTLRFHYLYECKPELYGMLAQAISSEVTNRSETQPWWQILAEGTSIVSAGKRITNQCRLTSRKYYIHKPSDSILGL